MSRLALALIVLVLGATTAGAGEPELVECQPGPVLGTLRSLTDPGGCERAKIIEEAVGGEPDPYIATYVEPGTTITTPLEALDSISDEFIKPEDRKWMREQLLRLSPEQPL